MNEYEMVSLPWFRKRPRELTRTEIEKLAGLDCSADSDLERLRWLLNWTFLNSTYSKWAITRRTRREGLSTELADMLRAGGVTADTTWGQVDIILRACDAPPAATEVARDLFHHVRRACPELDPVADVDELGAAAPRPEGWTGQICSVLLTDVVDFGKRTDQDRRVIREAMYRIVREAFTATGISLDDWHHEGRGDGILAIMSTTVPPKHLVHPFLTDVTEQLSRYNATAAGDARFKLRVALHAGPVESDAEGVSGQGIVEAARLIDAQGCKEMLAKAPPGTCVGFIASDFVFNNVIKQHPDQFSPTKYLRIAEQVKEYDFTAWIRLAPDSGAITGQPDA